MTSGKGGVGKSNIVANLAVEMSRRGRKVLVLDADLGLANVDILLGLAPVGHLGDVVSGNRDIDDIILHGPEDVDVLPAASGMSEITTLTEAQKRQAFGRSRPTQIPLRHVVGGHGCWHQFQCNLLRRWSP